MKKLIGCELSNHAVDRMTSRGITEEDISNILNFGQVYDAGSQCLSYFLGNKKAFKNRFRDNKNIEKSFCKALVISNEGCIVTVMHCKHKYTSWKRL